MDTPSKKSPGGRPFSPLPNSERIDKRIHPLDNEAAHGAPTIERTSITTLMRKCGQISKGSNNEAVPENVQGEGCIDRPRPGEETGK